MLRPNESLIQEGTFLYDGTVEGDIRIVHSPVRYGSGDHEDLPDIQNDLTQDTYYVWYGSTTERGVYVAGGGHYASLQEAVQAVEGAHGIGTTARWNNTKSPLR
jgi:hypothetical protein